MNHVADAMKASDILLMPFSYRFALFSRWDVLHVHWPEGMVRHRRLGHRLLRLLMMAALLARIVVGRKAVLRTLHNTRPHELGSRPEALLIRLLDRVTTTVVMLNPYSEPLRSKRSAAVRVISHGHYRDLLNPAQYPSTQHDIRLLYFGFLKPYKHIDDLLAAFAGTDEDIRLRLIGRAVPELAEAVKSAAASDNRISAYLDFASDEELSQELAQCHLAIFPYLDPHNSGAVFHALSANRPILVAENDVTRWIADEVGSAWVQFFSPPLDAAQLSVAVERVRGNDYTDPVKFVNRDWVDVAEAYVEAYRSAATGGPPAKRLTGRIK